MFGTRKLGKTSAQRKALLRQQVTDLLENGKMETTFYRAKEVQPVVEKMITLGKKGNLAAYRKAMSFITKEDVAHKLFKEIAPKYADRNGGYTRVTRTGARRGDAFGHAVARLRGFLHAHALAQVVAEGVVARQRRSACGDQVAHAGQTVEGLGQRASPGADVLDLGQAACLDHRGRVLAEARAMRHAHGERHHVLERSAQFQADHVGGDEGLEVVGRAQFRHAARHVDVGAADHGGGGFARGDLLAQVRSRDRHKTVGGQVERLGDHLVHALAGLLLNALHQ